MTNSFVKAFRPVAHMIVGAFVCSTGLLITQAFLPNFLIGSICGGENECSNVIYLGGVLQLGIGIGGVVMAPILGGLSDSYGRKPILILIFAAATGPQVLLACIKTKTAVYIWYFVAIIAYTFMEGGFAPTLLAAVADVVDENHRPAVNGLAIASLSIGSVGGILASMVLATVDQALWASVILQVCATIYLMVYMIETNPREPLLPANESKSESAMKLLPKPEIKRRVYTNFRETARTVWSSRRLMTIGLVDFLNTYAFTGMNSFTVFYLIAAFGYGQKQIATIFLLIGGGSALGMTLVYPVMSQFLGERVVLWVGLLVNAGQYLLYGLAWTPWLPFLAAGMEVFHSMTKPALGTMVSRGVDHEQQGKIQGFMAAIRSMATILAPLTITPLAAESLGGNPPFGLMGFPFIVCASAMALAWLISTLLPPLSAPVNLEVSNEYIQAQMPPVEDKIVPC